MTSRQVVDVDDDSTAAPGHVWALLADATTWTGWARFSEATYEREGTPAPHGLGAVRRFRVGPLRSREEVLAFDPPRQLAYDYDGTLPITNYRSDVTLLARDDGGTHIRWHSEFEGKVALAGPPMRWFLTRAIRDLTRRLAEAAARDGP